MNEFPTCNRKAPAAPYYAALHSMNRGPEGRWRTIHGLIDSRRGENTTTTPDIDTMHYVYIYIYNNYTAWGLIIILFVIVAVNEVFLAAWHHCLQCTRQILKEMNPYKGYNECMISFFSELSWVLSHVFRFYNAVILISHGWRKHSVILATGKWCSTMWNTAPARSSVAHQNHSFTRLTAIKL